MKGVMAIAVALSTLWGCTGKSAAVDVSHAVAVPPAPPGSVVIPTDSPMLKQIKRETVQVAALPADEVIAPGKVEANPNRVAKVVLPVAGRIMSVLVKTGDAVKNNQPLLTIQSPDADAAMSTFLSAEASATYAQAGLNKAQSDFDRSSDLFEHNALAKKDVLSAESALAQAKAGLAQAQAAREQALRRLAGLGLSPGDFKQDVVVRSPLAGKVLELSVVPGEFRNDTSASLMTIADLSTVWITSQVPESYIRFVQLGERIEISLVAYPGETSYGRVSRIADAVDSQTRTVKVSAEIENHSGRFRPEMFGSIHHVEPTVIIPVVPAAALIQEGDQAVVFVERSPGHFEERRVLVGKRAGDRVRILGGVTPGESIAVDGVMLLKGLEGK